MTHDELDAVVTVLVKLKTPKTIFPIIIFALCISTPIKSLKNIKGPHESFMGF